MGFIQCQKQNGARQVEPWIPTYADRTEIKYRRHARRTPGQQIGYNHVVGSCVHPGSRGQVLRVLFSEYLTLGLLASATATLLAIGSGWGLTELVFESRFRLPVLPLAGLSLAVTGLTVVGGLASSLEQLRRTPLEALRAESRSPPEGARTP